MNKLLKISLAIIPVAVLLTGCSTANNDVSKEPTVKEAEFKITKVSGEDMNIIAPDYADIGEVQNGKILYTSFGSSSCPKLVEKVSQDKEKYTLHLKQYDSKIACTADLSPSQQIIEKTNGEKIPQNAQLVIEHS